MSRSREKGVAAMVNRISLHHSSANQDFDYVYIYIHLSGKDRDCLTIFYDLLTNYDRDYSFGFLVSQLYHNIPQTLFSTFRHL